MSTTKTPVDIQLALLKAASYQLDDGDIRGNRFDHVLHELLHQAVDCIGAQIAEKNLTGLRLGAASTRGNEYLKQAIRNNEKYEARGKQLVELRKELDATTEKLDAALAELPELQGGMTEA